MLFSSADGSYEHVGIIDVAECKCVSCFGGGVFGKGGRSIVLASSFLRLAGGSGLAGEAMNDGSDWSESGSVSVQIF